MPDPNDIEIVSRKGPEAAKGAGTPVPDELRTLVERLRGLQSAWVVLAPSCLTSTGQEIVQAGRVARKELATLAGRGGSINAESFDQLKTRLDWLEHAICTIAFGLPTHQLEATLPSCLRSGRRGLLDLLDILALHAFERPESLASKLGALDYLITLLCTGGDTRGHVAPQDPSLLTPRFQAMCDAAQNEYQAELSKIEAEFFAAANVAADLQDEVELRGLRARKAELGRSYFAPSMLRAIVTYNVALGQSVAAEVWDSRDWSSSPTPLPEAPQEPASLFESLALRSIHQAVLHRIAGGPPETTPIGRIAWALDIACLNDEETAMLTGGTIARTELATSIVLIGLVCRSLNVLAIELQDIDVDPDLVSDHWVKELDELQKEQVNASIAAGDAYSQAVKISELRNKFLYDAMRGVHKDNRGNTPRSAPPPSETEERKTKNEARALASEALTDNGAPRRAAESDPETAHWRDWQWRVIAPTAAILVFALTMGLQQLGFIDLLGRDLDRWGGGELASVSPHLTKGHRNEDGAGIAFVGTIDETWLALATEKRQRAAEELVGRLRNQGVEQVMIYDDQNKLRIQALGEKVRML